MPHRRPTTHVAPPSDGAPVRAPGGPPAGGAPLPCPDPEGPEQYLSQWCEHRRLTLLADTQIRWVERAKQATSDSQYAYAAAYSTVIFIILLVYGYFQTRMTRATESY